MIVKVRGCAQVNQRTGDAGDVEADVRNGAIGGRCGCGRGRDKGPCKVGGNCHFTHKVAVKRKHKVAVAIGKSLLLGTRSPREPDHLDP